MNNIYVCYYDKLAFEKKSLPEILFLKKHRNVCFYDSENDVFYDASLKTIDIKGKIIIPHTYCNQEKSLPKKIIERGGIIPCDLVKTEQVSAWPLFYNPNRRIQLITGKDLIDEKIINKLEIQYGKKIFFKTIEKGYSDIVNLDDLRNSESLIHVALSMHDDETFIISEVVDILSDDIGNKEYRVFVFNNEILSISRHTEFILHSIEPKIYNKAKEVVESMRDKDFPTAYVFDLFEYLDKNNDVVIDVCEFNGYIASGFYLYNSIDFYPSVDLLHNDINNISIESRELISFCKMPDKKYKRCLSPSKVYSDKGTFAYDLKQIHDYNSIIEPSNNINLSKNVSSYICSKHDNVVNKEEGKKRHNLGILGQIVSQVKESIEDDMKQEFFKNVGLSDIQLTGEPGEIEYLCKIFIPDDSEEIDLTDPPKTLKITPYMMKKLQSE